MSGLPAAAFARYVGIDYSGAKTPTSSLPGLRVYLATRTAEPLEIAPPPGPKKYWTRRGVAEWLVNELDGRERALVGIDHGFSFPLRYFETHGLTQDWPTFLGDFCRHWPTAEDLNTVDMVRRGAAGDGASRSGDTRWRRRTEVRAGAAKSVFHFDVQGSVAKSTHSGLPWLQLIRQRRREKVHFWPFDGWQIPADRSAIVEVYPALWSRGFPREDRTSDQHDAYSAAAWLREADLGGSLADYLDPVLPDEDRAAGSVEGWILGVR